MIRERGSQVELSFEGLSSRGESDGEVKFDVRGGRADKYRAGTRSRAES